MPKNVWSLRMQLKINGLDTQRAGVLLAVGAAIYLYANLFVSARIPILLSGDQVYFWMEGQRILFGEQPYRDFFQFTPPGTDSLYFSLFKIFGLHIWITNLVVLTLGVALSWLCFSIATHLMAVRLALAAAILFLTLIYTRLLNATHHWFSILLVLCAVKAISGKLTAWRILAVGLLLGGACFFTQSHGVVAMLAVQPGWCGCMRVEIGTGSHFFESYSCYL
jgi:hypothetical protein